MSKSYGPRRALERLDLEVREGELMAILGPNGAGKTTSIEIMEGFRKPDAGVVSVLGLDPRRDAHRLRPQVGLMLQEGGLYPTLTVGESLRLFASFYREPLEVNPLLERVGLSERTRARFRQLSGGERQRLSLALALVGRPRLLFLDEPTAGMDPRARIVTWEVVQECRRQGCTVLLTTHSMEEAERLSDRVAIISAGRLVACDSPAALRASAPTSELELELDSAPDAGTLRRLRELPAVDTVSDQGAGRLLLSSPQPRQAIAEVSLLFRDVGPQIVLLRSGHRSLERIFLELTGEETT